MLFLLIGCAPYGGNGGSRQVIYARAVSLPETFLRVTIGRTSQKEVLSELGRPNQVHFRTNQRGRTVEIFEYIPYEIIINVWITSKSGVEVKQIYSPGRENILYMEFTNGILTAI
ncbi:MAG: hypothetical protein LBE80_05445 [Deltaproteobacteria bacterium]|nr:hypothetical protein [Deltaproteobacteria bacterium]